jgi:hypothetical protein
MGHMNSTDGCNQLHDFSEKKKENLHNLPDATWNSTDGSSQSRVFSLWR